MIDMCLEVTFSLTLASEMMLMFETSYIGSQNTHTHHKNIKCAEGRIWLSFPLNSKRITFLAYLLKM
jgi:hypothetical protein